MKITTYAVYDFATGELLEEESYDYFGPVSEAKKGGGGSSTQTIQKADPWAGVQDDLNAFYAKVNEWGYGAPTAQWAFTLPQDGWYPKDPIVNYQNQHWLSGTGLYTDSLNNIAQMQAAQISPFQNLTDLYAATLSNPYRSGMPTDMASAYSTPWSNLNYGDYLGDAALSAGYYQPQLSNNLSQSSWNDIGNYLGQGMALTGGLWSGPQAGLYGGDRYGAQVLQNAQSLWGGPQGSFDAGNQYAANALNAAGAMWSGPSNDWSSIYAGTPNYVNAASYLNQANSLLPDYRNLESTINFEDANPYLEQQISDMRDNAQKELARQQLQNQDIAQQAGQLGSSRDVMQEMLLNVDSSKAMNQAETSMRAQAWDAMLREQTARGQIEAQNQANILGYLGQGYQGALGYGQGMAGTQADLQAAMAQAAMGYSQGLQGLGSQYAASALGDALGFQGTMAGLGSEYGLTQNQLMQDYAKSALGTSADQQRAFAQLGTQLGMNSDQLRQAYASGALGDILGYQGQMTGTQADFLRSGEDTAANYDVNLQSLNQDYLKNALNQALGFTGTMSGTQAGYLSELNNAALGYQGDRQSNYMDYLTNADKTNAVLYGMAPQIYGQNASNYLAPYMTGLQMGDFQYGLGDQLSGYQQALLNNDIAKYEYDRDFYTNKLNQINMWLNGIGGMGGTTTTTANNPAGSPWVNALGGGLMGMSAQNALLTSPMVMGAGPSPLWGGMMANPMMGFGLGALLSFL